MRCKPAGRSKTQRDRLSCGPRQPTTVRESPLRLAATRRWEKDTVAVWDNRATVHYGVSDYGDQHRLLHRVTFGEDRAF